MFVPRVQSFQSRALVPVLLLLLAMRPAQPYPLPFPSRRRSPPYVTATGSSSSNADGAAASASAGSGTRSATAGMGQWYCGTFHGRRCQGCWFRWRGYLRFGSGRRGCCGMGISSSARCGSVKKGTIFGLWRISISRILKIGDFVSSPSPCPAA